MGWQYAAAFPRIRVPSRGLSILSGEVRERLNRPDSKSGIPLRVSWVRIPPSPPLPCRETAIGRPQARKAPSSRAIFQMPSEPRRLGDTSKAVSERLLSLITRTPPPAVRVQNSLRLQRFGLMNGTAVRRRYSTQCAVRESEVESLCGLLGKGPLPGAEPTGRNDPKGALSPPERSSNAIIGPP